MAHRPHFGAFPCRMQTGDLIGRDLPDLAMGVQPAMDEKGVTIAQRIARAEFDEVDVGPLGRLPPRSALRGPSGRGSFLRDRFLIGAGEGYARIVRALGRCGNAKQAYCAGCKRPRARSMGQIKPHRIPPDSAKITRASFWSLVDQNKTQVSRKKTAGRAGRFPFRRAQPFVTIGAAAGGGALPLPLPNEAHPPTPIIATATVNTRSFFIDSPSLRTAQLWMIGLRLLVRMGNTVSISLCQAAPA